MKVLFWMIAVVALGVGVVAAALRSGSGYVQIVLPPYRVEVSLVLTLLSLVGVFFVLYGFVRLGVAMMAMPQQVREYRASLKKKNASEVLHEALQEYFSGRFARTEKAAQKAIELKEQVGLAAIVAARAAHELRAYERRDQYLQLSAASMPQGEIMTVITKAELLLREHRVEEALAALKKLEQKNTAGLRIELKALQLDRQWELTLPVIERLARRRVFTQEQALHLQAHAIAEHLKIVAVDLPALNQAWRKVPEVLRQEALVAGVAARLYLRLNVAEATQRAVRILEVALEAHWDSDLASVYGQSIESAGCESLAQIERAEGWLGQHPQDAALLLCLGKLCMSQALWGKAQNYVDASLAVQTSYQALLSAAQLQERLGQTQRAHTLYRRSLDEALKKLSPAESLFSPTAI
jgi:HemY protein